MTKKETMHRTVFTALAVSLMVLSLAACQQDAPTGRTFQQKQITEMMSDSSVVNTVMDHIASDSHMRMMMTQKMIHHTRADSTGMMQMCAMMTTDKDMHAMMMRMMGTAMMDSTAMMKPGLMQKR